MPRQWVALILAAMCVTGALLVVPTAKAEQPELYCANYYTLDGGCPPPTDWTGWTSLPLYNEGINWNGGFVAVQDYDASIGYTQIVETCCRNTDYINVYPEGEKFPKVWNASKENALIHGRFGV